MFRKLDSSLKPRYMPVYHWFEETLRVLPDKNNEAFFEKVECSEVLKTQLDIQAVNLDVMIKNGVTLDPAQVGRMLNLTDQYDISKYNEQRSISLYQYLKDNEDKVKEALRAEFESRMSN